MRLGTNIKQPAGYKAYIPKPFPPADGFELSSALIQKANVATLKLGKLDGTTQLLPDLDFFLFMYIRKDAASSSQIEGTQATMIDAIEAESKTNDKLPDDVDDILHYIRALQFGLKKMTELPLSLRLIKEIHRELMDNARKTHFSDPGNFRTSQNWIGGTKPTNARFVPPPPDEMKRALSDLEKFIHAKDTLLPVVKAGLLHAQFENIHPFLDGNGRTGRMLITIYLHLAQILEHPILFLSWYFKKHQQLYYDRLYGYSEGNIEAWINFFLDGIIETSEEAISTVKQVTILKESDMLKIQSLGRSAAQSAVIILPKLYQMPIVNVHTIQRWTGFTRQGAQKVIDRFVELDILQPKNENVMYGRSFTYRKYLEIFE